MPMNTQILTQALWQGLLLSLAINLFFFFLAQIKQSDHFTDITYALSFITLGFFYTLRSSQLGVLQMIALTLVVAWAVRLGSYLLLRIFWMGKDARFDHMRHKPLRFLSFWLLQALTVWVVLLPLYAFTQSPTPTRPWLSGAGLFIWLIGLTLETVADMQKFTFKAKQPEGQWIDQGLWSLSRHPNFFGEMLVWWGFFMLTLPSTWPLRALAMVGPLFITLLIRFVSGVPLLEKSAQKKYGHLPQYQAYHARTRLLFPCAKKNSQANAS